MKTKLKIIIPAAIAVIAVIIAAVFINFSLKESVDVASLMSTAQKYLVEQNYEQAIAEFGKVIDLDPMNADAYLGLADAYIGMGDTASAIEWLQKGYELTGDERLKKMLDSLLPADEAAGNNDPGEDPASISGQDELFEIDEEIISLTVPYKIETDGETNDSWGKRVQFDGFSIGINDYNYIPESPTYISYSFEKPYSESRTSFLSVAQNDVYIYQRWDIGYSSRIPEPSAISPAVSVYHIDGTPIWEVKDKYNKDMQLVRREISDENGLLDSIEYVYDENGWIIEVRYSSGQVTYYEYDQNGNIISDGYTSYEYDQKGNLLRMSTSGDSVWEYTYDPAGNCLTKKAYYKGEFDYSYEYEYYPDGSLAGELYTNDKGYFSQDKYYKNGIISEHYNNHPSNLASHDKYIYDEHGYMTQYLDGDTVVHTFTNVYDSSGRIISITNEKNKHKTIYEYDSSGNLIKETMLGADSDILSMIIYTYDPQNKLLSKIGYFVETDGTKEGYRYEYEYDSYGNMLKITYYSAGEYKGSAAFPELITLKMSKAAFDEAFNS